MKKLALITLISLLSIASLLLLWQLRSVVGILLVAIFLATTMSGFVQHLIEREWSPRIARLLVIVGALLSLAILVALTVYAIAERVPQALNDFRAMYSELRSVLLAGNGSQRALASRLPPSFLLDDLFLGSDGSGLLTIASGISSNFGALASNIILVIFVAIYWVADRDRIERLWFSLLAPERRMQTRSLLYHIEEEVGANLRSQIVQYAFVLLCAMIGYRLIGSKYPFLLAWFISLAWLIPLIGSFFAIIVAFLVGLIDGYLTATFVMLYTIMIFIAVPILSGRLHVLRQNQGSILGLMVAIALIDVMGIVGVLIAMPVTVVVQILLSHFLNPSLQQAEQATSSQPDFRELHDRFSNIQARVEEARDTLSPRTRSIFSRLEQLIAQANNG